MRCNIISPHLLTDQHLIAEKRELRMIPPLFEKRWNKLGIRMFRDIPPHCVLGRGHMLFWTNKLGYLNNRFEMIVDEMKTRGFNPDESITLGITDKMIEHSVIYSPSTEDELLLKSRIREKLLMKPEWYRYKGRPITKQWVDIVYGSK